MKRFKRELVSLASAFLIAFSTFGNAFFIAEASEPAAIETTVPSDENTLGGEALKDAAVVASTEDVKEAETVKEENKTPDSEEKKETSAEVDSETGAPATTATTTGETPVVAGKDTGSTTPGASEETAEVKLVVTALPQAGEVAEGTEIKLSCDAEGAVIRYNTDGSKNFKEYSADTRIVVTKDMTISAYATLNDESDDGKEPFTFAYTVKKEVKEDAAAAETADSDSLSLGEKLTDLAGGETVVIAVGDRALTSVADGSKLKSAQIITSEDGKSVTVSNDATVFTVVKADSYVAFMTAEGKYLSTPDKATQGLTFVDAIDPADNASCEKWVLEKSGDKNLLMSNTVLASNNKNQYLSCKKEMFSVLTNNSGNKSSLPIDFYFVEQSAAAKVAAPTASVVSGSKVEFGEEVG